MLTLSKTNQIVIGVLLALILIATRGHHFASLVNLPSASLAVFFLAGVYLKPNWILIILLAMCAGLDFIAINFNNVSSFCVTPAYAFLVPAYSVMWLAGRWFSKQYSFTSKALLPLIGSVTLSASVSELFSSGGFYFFGGHFSNTTLIEFLDRLVQYFPQQLQGLVFWLSVAIIVHVAFTLVSSPRNAKA